MLRWWSIASLCALACSACSAPAHDDTIDIVFDACAPIHIALPDDELRATAVREAFALWAAHGVPLMGEPGGAELQLVFEPAAEAFFGLYDDEHAVIYINTRLTDPRALSIVIAHELGHAMGLPHVTGEVSLMNPANRSSEPTPADEARVRALWGSCD